MLESTNTLSSSTPGRSQNGCLVGKTSRMSLNFSDQTDRHDVRKSLSDLTHPARMSSWRDSVLAAEATKAGSASDHTRLIIIIIIIIIIIVYLRGLVP